MSKRKLQAELECRYWDLTGELPYPRFKWYHRGYSHYLDNLAIQIARIEDVLYRNQRFFNPGP